MSIFSKNISVVGIVSDMETFSVVGKSPCDIVEVRYDLFQPSTTEFEKCPKPILLTNRAIAEGGSSTLSLDENIRLMEALFPFVDAVDIDASALGTPNTRAFVKAAHEKDVCVVVSSHWFERIPTLQEVLTLEESAKNVGADILKIAYNTFEKKDIAFGLKVLEAVKMPLVIMGMGKYGKESRNVFSQNGSKAIYGYVGNNPTVQGQPSTEEIFKNLLQTP